MFELLASQISISVKFLYVLIIVAAVLVAVLIFTIIMCLADIYKNKKDRVASRSEITKTETLDQNQSETELDDIPDNIKAAIIASIMAFYDQPKCEFIVRRIKRY